MIPLNYKCPKCGGELEIDELWFCSSLEVDYLCKECDGKFREEWEFKNYYELSELDPNSDKGTV